MERAFLMQKTEEKSCGICMENIAEKNLRFGILNGCQHCFCLECIRQWRTQDQRAMDMATKTVRSCPECRQHSDYVIPSLFWVESGQEKELLIQMYKENTKSQVCKYYSRNNKRRGDCPFGNKCFYKHQLPDGSIDPGESPHARRRARLVDYIFEEDDDLLLGEDDEDFDLSENGSGFRRFMENLDRNSGQGELFRIITSFVRELQGDDRPHRTP
uniref:RING-type E3 ubiquitin transferase n=2 Tax=Caenorhabditis tropicalis TaxID=1561998 RepID=A0A1I7UZ74_9PELO